VARRMRFAVGAATIAAVTTLGAPSALAVCDAYSGACVRDDTRVLPTTVLPPEQSAAVSGPGAVSGAATTTGPSAPSTLPFTGGEALLIGVLGAGALVGGTALVVAGRRRPTG